MTTVGATRSSGPIRRARDAGRRLRGPIASAAGSNAAAARAGRVASLVVAYAVGIKLAFDPDLGSLASGIAVGSLYGLIAVGLILIYRTNRIINFAVGAIGAFPAALAALLVTIKGVNYWLVLPIVLIGGPLIGAAVDVCIIRRFANAPRLIVTVATIGVAQILAYVTLYVPRWLDSEEGIEIQRLLTPASEFRVSDKFGVTVFT